MANCTFLGHSCVRIEHGETTLLIDPFLTGNPLAAESAEQQNPTAILLTHGHNDHVGDALAIAKRSDAQIIGNFEIATWCQAQGAQAHGMHIGGGHDFPWGWIKLTQAWHGSTYIGEDGSFTTLGVPTGLLIRMGGKLIYHAGDTGLFGDMALIGRHLIDLAFVPIGDNYTMGPADALEAVKLLNPAQVVPIHYDTFEVIQQDAQAWAARVNSETESEALVIEPGQSIEI